MLKLKLMIEIKATLAKSGKLQGVPIKTWCWSRGTEKITPVRGVM